MNPFFHPISGFSCDETHDFYRYIFTRSARAVEYRKYKESCDNETITNILAIFISARIYCDDLFPNVLAMFVYIDNVFDNNWLTMLDYCAERSYACRYYRIIFYASLNGWLSGMRPSKVLAGELDDEFSMVLLSEEFDIGAIEEIMSIISAKDDEQHMRNLAN